MSEIKALYARRSARDEDSAEPSEDFAETLYKIAAQVFQCAPKDLSPASQADVLPGWTSLSHIEMMLAIEERFGFKLSSREIMKFRTLGDATEIVRSRMAS